MCHDNGIGDLSSMMKELFVKMEEREVKNDENMGRMQDQLDGLERLIIGKGPVGSAPAVSDRPPTKIEGINSKTSTW